MPNNNRRPTPSTGMKLVSLRMSEDSWNAIQDEARLAGVSASEFIREATFVRLGWRWAQRLPDDDVAARLRKIGALREGY